MPSEVSAAGDERDRDGERDEQHHPWLAGADLGDRPGEEWPTAVEEDDGAENGRDPRRTGGQRVAEDVGEHRAEADDRKREQQAPPEPVAELGGVVPVVVPAVAVADRES